VVERPVVEAAQAADHHPVPVDERVADVATARHEGGQGSLAVVGVVTEDSGMALTHAGGHQGADGVLPGHLDAGGGPAEARIDCGEHDVAVRSAPGHDPRRQAPVGGEDGDGGLRRRQEPRRHPGIPHAPRSAARRRS
jgi:hypothetical protein